MIVNFSTESYIQELNKPFPASIEQFNLDRVGVIVLAGGQGERLKPLTLTRCKPALSFGGRYNLIDIPISHSLNSGLRNIFVIGQYLAYSLQKHLFQTYFHHGIESRHLQMIVPEQRADKKVWYKGTADAIRQNLEYFADLDVDYFLILSGDQLYNIDFKEMIDQGRKSGADMTIAVKPVNKNDAKRMGLLGIDPETLRVKDFYEKPQEEAILEKYYTDDTSLSRLGIELQPTKNYLASMGIYFFKRQSLFDLLLKDEGEDFGKHLIKKQMQTGEVRAYLYGGYWEDIGTVDSYYRANLALTRHQDDGKLGLKCHDKSQIIHSQSHNLPGAKISGTLVKNSILCEGALIEAEEISNSIIGVRSVIRKKTVIRDSILIGNEYYRRPLSVSGEMLADPGIGENCFIAKAIIDENVYIGNNVKLLNQKKHIDFESQGNHPKIYVKDGVIIVPRGAVIPDGYIF